QGFGRLIAENVGIRAGERLVVPYGTIIEYTDYFPGTNQYQYANELEFNVQGAVIDSKLEPENIVFRNGVIEFKTLVEAGAAHAKTGIEFRGTGEYTNDSHYVVVLEREEGQTSWQLKLVKGTYSSFAETGQVSTVYDVLASEEVSVNESSWNSFRVYAVGGTFKVSLNDQLIIDYNDLDNVIEEGAIRLVTGTGTAAAFDDLIVTSYVYQQGLASSVVVTDKDFSDWVPWVDGGSWETSFDGTYITQARADGVEHMAVLDEAVMLSRVNTTVVSDIVADMDIKFDSRTATSGGIIFRSDNNYENYLELKLDSSDGRVYLNRIDQTGRELIAFGQVPVHVDRWYHMKVKAIGEHIEVYINGKKVVNVVDTQFDFSARGKVALFTSQGTKASFKNIELRSVTPVEVLLDGYPESGISADEYTFLKKLNTLSRTKDFDGNLRINADDRILFEAIGSDKFTFLTNGELNTTLLKDVASAVDLTRWNKETNAMPGDINSDGEVDVLDVNLVEKIGLLTSNVNAKYYINDVLGVYTTNLSALQSRTSDPYYEDALGAAASGTYSFAVLEFLIKYTDLNGDGAVNYKDTKLFIENFMMYEFLAAMKSAMEAIEFIPSETYGSLSLGAFQTWDAAEKALFIEKLNEYISTMDTSGATEEYRDYNGDGTIDFNDRNVWEHYGATDAAGALINAIDEGAIIAAAVTYRRDIDGDGQIKIDDEEGFDDLAFVKKVFALTHDALTPEELARADVDGNGKLDDEDMNLYRSLQEYYVDITGDEVVDLADLLEMQSVIVRKRVTDVNLDGIVNEGDRLALGALLGFEDVIYDVDSALQGGSAISHHDIQVTKDGNYQLGFHAKAAIGEGEIPEGYRFVFRVSLNGKEKGQVVINPLVLHTAYGYINLGLGKGNYSMTIEWTNPLEGVQAVIERTELSSSVDMNGTGVVDTADISLLEQMIDDEIAGVDPRVYDLVLTAGDPMDLDSDGDVDWDDYNLLKTVIETMKDINGDGKVDQQDIEKIKDVTYLYEMNELYESTDIDG
ncbi:family 16 glycoside hydrolase, partial [Candidatus Omnitrophota bacterium]